LASRESSFGCNLLPFGSRRRSFKAFRVSASIQRVKKSDLGEMEIQLAITKKKMETAAEEQRFQDAAKFRDRLEVLRLEQRCMDVQHKQALRDSICHRLGSLMTHKAYKYKGVIFGVHHFCQASESWIQTMRVDQLPNGRHQPFYQILVDERDRPDGRITYVAQENIAAFEGLLDGMQTIVHSQVAKMFTRFNEEERKYEPCAELIQQYPDSLEAQEVQEASQGLEDSGDVGVL